jgi:hypothetical protein
MLKRGGDAEAKARRRFGPGGQNGDPWSRSSGDPFDGDPSAAPASASPPVLGGWTAMASFLDLEPSLVAEMARASMSSGRVVALRSGEIGVGAMLASLAVRGEDILLDELLPLGSAEIRVHRYTVGKLEPIAVHPVLGIAPLLRALALCAASATHESWEAVAHDGVNPPVAIGSAQKHELRWLQPPAADAPHSPPWMTPTTDEPPPGTSVAAWQEELQREPPPPPQARPLAAPPAARLPESDAPIGPVRPAGPAPVAPAAPVPTSDPGFSPEELLGAITASVQHALANALLELELDPATIAQLRDDRIPQEIVEGVARLEAHLAQVDLVGRQIQDLTTAVDAIAESMRSMIRHQWDNAPPPNFWVKVQRADDEVRRAVDELTSEVRTRISRPTRGV